MMPYTYRAKGHDVKENYELARSCTYDLLSVVVHVGAIETGMSHDPVEYASYFQILTKTRGHYISYCRIGDQVSDPRNLVEGLPLMWFLVVHVQ